MNINIPDKFWKVAMFAGAMFGLFLLIGSVHTLATLGTVGKNPNQTNTITVSGTGDALAVPDVATFTFSVSDTEKTVADAQTKATAAENAALAVVRQAGVADTDIQTVSYDISPQYEYLNAVCPQPAANGSSVAQSIVYCPPGKQTLTGYQVSETIQVKLRDLSKAGSLLTALGSANVSNLGGPSFSVDNPDAVQDQARSKAIADARSRADQLAKELGVTIVGVTSFSEDNGSYPRPIMYALGATAESAKAAPTPEVPAGQQKVTDNVTVTYEIR